MPMTIRGIQDAVARRYGVTVADIVSKRQGAVVRSRHVAMWLCRHLTPHSLPEIGRAFGDRDHTTVLHALRRVEALLATDEAKKIWDLLTDVNRVEAVKVRSARLRAVA